MTQKKQPYLLMTLANAAAWAEQEGFLSFGAGSDWDYFEGHLEQLKTEASKDEIVEIVPDGKVAAHCIFVRTRERLQFHRHEPTPFL